jgi:hypothetical protein
VEREVEVELVLQVGLSTLITPVILDLIEGLYLLVYLGGSSSLAQAYPILKRAESYRKGQLAYLHQSSQFFLQGSLSYL